MKNTQQQILLSQLRKGPVNSYFATYTLRIKQAPTRVRELKDMGYVILSTPTKDRSVDWTLLGSPIDKSTTEPIISHHYVTTSDNSMARHLGSDRDCADCMPRQGVLL